MQECNKSLNTLKEDVPRYIRGCNISLVSLCFYETLRVCNKNVYMSVFLSLFQRHLARKILIRTIYLRVVYSQLTNSLKDRCPLP